MKVPIPTTRPRRSCPRTHDPKTRLMIAVIASMSGNHSRGTADPKARPSAGRSLSTKNAKTGTIRRVRMDTTIEVVA